MKRKFLSRCILFGAALISSASAFSFSDEQRYVPGELLVVPRTNMTLQGASAQAVSQGFKLLPSHRGNTPFLRLKLKSGEDIPSMLIALASQPWVEHVQPNFVYHTTALPNDPHFSQYWGLQNSGQSVNGYTGTFGADISAASAWDEITDCSAITVAVIDSGVDYNHPDLTANIWTNTGETAGNALDDDGNGFTDDIRGWDFVQSDNDPMDFAEHGTHVAGTIGAVGNNATGGVGLCWQVKIMPLRVLDAVGSGTTSGLIAAIDYAVANGARVIIMSLGGTGGAPGDLLDQEIAAANTAGVLVVAASGNDGTDNDTIPNYPSSYAQPNIIAVTATDPDDNMAGFSNFGATSVDVAAPGVNIFSTVPPERQTVWSENFDSGAVAGWTLETRDNTTDTLVANTVAVTNEISLSSPNSLTDSPGGDYVNDRSYRMISPVIDLSGEEGSVLNFSFNAQTEPGWDYFYAETSSNGTIWTVETGGSGDTGGWLAAEVTLDNSATSQFRFRLETDSSNTADGIHLDDLAITIPNTSPASHNAATDYQFFQGTSMATPHVAGLAALILAADPALTHLQVRDHILNNGDVLPAVAGTTVTGRRINAQMSMPLHAPTSMSATAISHSQVDLSWTDNSISEESYLVQRNSGSGFTTIATLAADTTSYSDTNTPANTTLSYRAVARARDGRLATSTSASATTPPALPQVSLAGDVSLIEGNSGTSTMTFTVQLSAQANSQVDVTYSTADGTATSADNDYVAIALGTVSFAATETVKTVKVTINGDTTFEPNETLTLTLDSVSANATLGAVTTSTGTINNDDLLPVPPPPASSGGGGGAFGPIGLALLLPSLFWQRRRRLTI